MSQVLSLDYLLEDVLVRVDGVRSMLHCGVVSKAWASAALREEMLVKFMAVRSPPLLGIVVEYGVWGHDMRYVEFTPMPGMDSPVHEHALEVEAAFAGDFSLDTVLFSGYGEVVVREKMAPRGYCKRSIVEPITTTRHLLPSDDFFQEAPASICACFVVIYGVKVFFDGYPQVHDAPYIHPGAYCLRVCTLLEGRWWVSVSFPIMHDPPCIPHENPRGLVIDGVLYMMYALGVLFSCELSSGAFGIVNLPESFSTAVDMDYTIARSGKSELCIVRLVGCSMQQWSCDMAGQDKNWILRSTYNLRQLFDCHIPASFWESRGRGGESSAGDPVSYSMKIRAAGENFAYAIITFDFCPWIYMIDTDKKKVVKLINSFNPVSVLSVTTVCMPWPKTFPRE
ncbi:hypothetical protein CFC21_042894 [Triticum aestivum]|uniref:F-box protein AT5G49610-like beta-propeller domain-containing protein n=2 Tax=Triticum aestivum TaxID=4565 RepID=A0A3B6FW22_WHEAT|nr:hypothetical protein CFC21_042894 [Triticum aestivum]